MLHIICDNDQIVLLQFIRICFLVITGFLGFDNNILAAPEWQNVLRYLEAFQNKSAKIERTKKFSSPYDALRLITRSVVVDSINWTTWHCSLSWQALSEQSLSRQAYGIGMVIKCNLDNQRKSVRYLNLSLRFHYCSVPPISNLNHFASELFTYCEKYRNLTHE